MASRSGSSGEEWGRTLRGVDALVVVTDADGVIVAANVTASALSDADRSLVGRPFVMGGWFTNMPASAARANTALMQAHNGEPVRCEIDVRMASGERQPYEFTLLPEVNASGAVTRLMITGVHSSISDQTESSRNAAFMSRLNDTLRPFDEPQRILEITTRMLCEHLSASRVMFADIDEAAGSVVVRHDHCDGCESVVGTWPIQDVTPDIFDRLRRGEPVVIRDLQGNTAAAGRLQTRGGGQAVLCQPLVRQGRLIAVLGVHQVEARDWTLSNIRLTQSVLERCWSTVERVRVQRRLAQTERQFEDLFEHAPDATLLVGMQGQIVLANRRAEALFGYAVGEMLGQPIEVLVPEAHRAVHVGLRTTYSAEGIRRIMSRRPGLKARRKDATLFPVEVSLNPIQTERGPMIAASVRDLTERERLERQLQKVSQMQTIGQLAGGVAHDFNNLLTVINATTELLLYQSAVPGRLQESMLREDLQTIIIAGQRAATLTQQLLALSRQQILNPIVVDLNRVIEQMEPILRRAIGEQVFLRIVPHAEALPVLVDRAQIDQVVLNLALNGREAMANGGVLSITLGRLTDDLHEWVTLAVRDTGDGMDEATCRRIFEPFFTTKGRGRGTGLGLSTANGIVEQSGGRIAVASAPGEGTTLTIRLPRVQTDDDLRTAPPRHTPVPRGETVLVVDDEDAVRNVTQMMLEIQGFDVITADSGEAALAVIKARSRPVDVVLMDVIMPGQSGPEAAEQMRAHQPDLCVIFMSGHTADLLPPDASGTQARHFLSKPFTLEQLGDAVRSAIGTQTA